MQDLNDKITGNSLTAPEWNQVPSEIQNVIESLGITLSGADLNQLGKAIAGYAANGTTYTDSGAANAYVLSPIGSKQTPPAYTDGFACFFRAGNANTSAATANAGALGVKNIKDRDGNDLRPGMIPAGALSLIVYDSANGWFELVEIGQRPELAVGFIDGLLWANNGVDVTNDFDISVGRCRSADDTTDLVLSAAQTKRMDAAWSTGSGGGALASGATAYASGVSYHVFIGIIAGVTEIIVDSDPAAANAIANHSLIKPRHIFSFLVEAGPALPKLFTDQVGANVRAVRDVQTIDVNNTGSTSGASAVLSVPTGIAVLANLVGYVASTTAVQMLITETRQTNTAPSINNYDQYVTAETVGGASEMSRLTNVSGQIRYRTSAVADALRIFTKGYLFLRG